VGEGGGVAGGTIRGVPSEVVPDETDGMKPARAPGLCRAALCAWVQVFQALPASIQFGLKLYW